MNMNRLISIILLFICYSIYSQNIVQIEWWLDNNYAERFTDTITPARNINGNISLDITNIPVGEHLISLRFRDSIGQWSPIVSKKFIKNSLGYSGLFLEQMEYWIDNNIENKTIVRLESHSANIDENLSLDLSNYSNGSHLLSLRFKDNAGKYSPIIQHIIKKFPSGYITNVITGYRYWFNNDQGSLQTENFNFPQQSIHNIISIPVGSYQDSAVSIINIQFKDLLGQWSEIYMDTLVYGGLTNVKKEPQFHNEQQLRIYPNPADDYITIDMPETVDMNNELIITDISGKMIKSCTVFYQTASDFHVDVSNLTDGIYIVHFNTIHKSYKNKLIIEKKY